MANLRFVMTGGPGAGKTTLLEALAERGYECVPESARAIIKQRLERGLSPRPAPPAFGQEILRMDVERYEETKVGKQPVFFDRSVLDALAMLDEAEALSPAELKGWIERCRYNAVTFLLPPWEEIYRTDAERDQSFADSIRVFDELRSWYARWHYEPVEVPRAGVAERADFVLRTVESVLACGRSGEAP